MARPIYTISDIGYGEWIDYVPDAFLALDYAGAPTKYELEREILEDLHTNQNDEVGCPVCSNVDMFTREINTKGRRYRCAYCFYNSESEFETVKSQKDITLSSFGLDFVCEICGEEIDSYNQGTVLRHMQKHEDDNKVSDAESEDSPIDINLYVEDLELYANIEEYHDTHSCFDFAEMLHSNLTDDNIEAEIQAPEDDIYTHRWVYVPANNKHYDAYSLFIDGDGEEDWRDLAYWYILEKEGLGKDITPESQSVSMAAEENIVHAVAVLQPDNSKVSGVVHFADAGSGVAISYRIKGLSDGKHGFHIHEYGDLTDGCTSACAHFNPDNEVHGGLETSVRHFGDLGNIESQKSISAGEIYLPKAKLDSSKYGILGRMMIVHADRDDLGKGGDAESLKTGNAGKRLACGVIGLAEPPKHKKAETETQNCCECSTTEGLTTIQAGTFCYDCLPINLGAEVHLLPDAPMAGWYDRHDDSVNINLANKGIRNEALEDNYTGLFDTIAHEYGHQVTHHETRSPYHSEFAAFMVQTNGDFARSKLLTVIHPMCFHEIITKLPQDSNRMISDETLDDFFSTLDFENNLDIIVQAKRFVTYPTIPEWHKDWLKHLISYVETGTAANVTFAAEEIVCPNCYWSWQRSEGGDDVFTCHKCGFDNETYHSEDDYDSTYGVKQAKIRRTLKNKIMKQAIMGTKAGQWSARKSQELKRQYEAACSKKGLKPYKGQKTKSQDNLSKWSKQGWKTASGKKSSVTGEPYFPAKAVTALKQQNLYAKAKRQKQAATKAGKQNARYSDDIRAVVKQFRAEDPDDPEWEDIDWENSPIEDWGIEWSAERIVNRCDVCSAPNPTQGDLCEQCWTEYLRATYADRDYREHEHNQALEIINWIIDPSRFQTPRKKEPMTCPQCNSGDLELQGQDADIGRITRTYSCSSCGGIFQENWAFDDYEITNKGVLTPEEKARAFSAPYQPNQTILDYTPWDLATSSAITGDFFTDSLKYGFGPESKSSENMR